MLQFCVALVGCHCCFCCSYYFNDFNWLECLSDWSFQFKPQGSTSGENNTEDISGNEHENEEGQRGGIFKLVQVFLFVTHSHFVFL